MNDKIFDLVIRNREQFLYRGKVTSISSVNESGKFDVLSSHANFISLIKEKLIIRDENGKVTEMPIEAGILKVEQDKADIFLGVKR